ncbi:DoxX family protein [Tenacibaculum aiptasiae]|uniref:DoxX family protein n=1 Tax=Tenacibaculum aiptasiae TaxID=426481 RepID=A0A7J5AAI6_9FLAO|nr:DoxX family protein [Tenacibaculum aiptasiae]KAB1154199.1 DoxX family protein [Tenacibaculum aiptasiae]
MKTIKILYWISISFFGLSMLSGAALYFFNYQHAYSEFSRLGFPTYIIYPLAIAKIVGVIAILQNKQQTIKEWAYAGFTFNLLFAFSAHYATKDGEAFGPALVLIFLIFSYILDKKRVQKSISNE